MQAGLAAAAVAAAKAAILLPSPEPFPGSVLSLQASRVCQPGTNVNAEALGQRDQQHAQTRGGFGI